ncbi:MAG: hypothetical protein PHX69_00895 [Simplicispira sp.]|uniref:hypothetical protein n=1 Tax=Simplicispira sp. TaxID=2015802 RepID=UPI00258ACA57|nr:hypothetical protein [Simplicispira sp.]MDD2690323.1 hypothetical protein [Simplicispira sp.]
MENISDILPGLLTVAHGQRNESILFAFQFKILQVRGVFFGRSKTLTIGISDKNVAWQCDVTNGVLSERIPGEAYAVIKEALVTEDGIYKNKQFFLTLKSVLHDVASGAIIKSPTDNEITALLRNCKTKDKKYDQDGDNPFFDHWRRVRPSMKHLQKIQRYFGSQVSEECFRNKVTGVWSPEPKDKSLLFLSPDRAVKEIIDTAKA